MQIYSQRNKKALSFLELYEEKNDIQIQKCEIHSVYNTKI